MKRLSRVLTGMLVLGATTACTLDPGEQDTAPPETPPTAEASVTAGAPVLDTRVGEPVWSTATSEDQSLLGLGAGVVRVMEEGAEGPSLVILDASTGDELWRQGLEGRGEVRYAPSAASSGTSADGSGLVTMGYQRTECADVPAGECRQLLRGVEVREALTGERRWRWEEESAGDGSGPAALPATVGDEIVAVGRGDGLLVALDVVSGEQVWEAADVERVVGIEGGLVVVEPTGGRPLRFLDAETGELVRALEPGDDAEGLVGDLLALRDDDRIAIEDARTGDSGLDEVVRQDGLAPVPLSTSSGLAWSLGDGGVATLLPDSTEAVETAVPAELDPAAVQGSVLLATLEVYVVPTEEGLRVLDLDGALGEPAGPSGFPNDVALAGGSDAAVIVESDLDEPDGATVEVLPVS